MDVNDNAGYLTKRGAAIAIASRLAPTEPCRDQRAFSKIFELR